MLLRLAVVSQMHSVRHSRLFKIAGFLISAILIFSLLFWLVEKPYRAGPEGFTFLDAIESIVIYTLSGFDVDPPHSIYGWAFAIISLLLGILFIGAFTAEVASIFVEARIKNHADVKSVIYQNHILVCGHLSDVEYFFEQLFHEDHGHADLAIVFLMPTPPTGLIDSLLTSKKYKRRVKYIIGSPLIEQDLERANAGKARAAFIFANRFAEDPDKEDAKTILRTLAIQNYNKKIITYVQVLKAKNKGHIKATEANYFLCIEELSLNIIAQSCINPGLTDLIGNLVNTSDDEPEDSQPEWLQEYILGTGREIYRVPAGLACFIVPFHELASAVYHQFGVTVIGMQKLDDDEVYTFAVNPGKEWDVDPGDYLFIIADDFDEAIQVTHQEDDFITPTYEFPEENEKREDALKGWHGNLVPREEATLTRVAFKDHIVVCGAGKDLPLLLAPLRSPDLLNYQRIVVLNPKPLDEKTWNEIGKLPEVYFLLGSPLDYADLKNVNIKNASKALILNNKDEVSTDDEIMVDADTVMTVMGIHTLGHDVYTIAEVIYSSNTNFLHSQDLESDDEESPFSVNEVVTMSRIADSIICQAYYTEHFIAVFDELFSVDVHDEEEERNTCEIYQIDIPKYYHTKTYEDLFHYLSYKHGIIPVGLYRTNGDGHTYVFTAPPKDTALKPNDRVYVFAPDEPML
ncbi:MAG: hypothetical protein ACI8RA_003013 [Chlamydiales bacterium]|jgi:hypothetical protein